MHGTSVVTPRTNAYRIRRLAAIIVSAMALAVAFVALPMSPADAQTTEGLAVDSTSVYTPDPARNEIRVTATFTLTNERADEPVGDLVRSYFFTTWTIALPVGAEDFAASSNGAALGTSIIADPDSNSFMFGEITLPSNLDYQETIVIRADYTIPGTGPRGDATSSRANESFLSFPVWVVADPGRADVRITVPDGFTLQFLGNIDGQLERVQSGDTVYYEATNIAEPRDFFGRAYGRNDSGLIAETADLANGSATVRAWPDDPEWANFVVDAIEQDVPVIEELTGLPWPAGDLEIIETVTPYLYGYGGWYNADAGLIEVGEELRREIILHELGHAWFNDRLISERWVVEGLAEEIAALVIEQTGDERPRPSAPDLDDAVRVPLQDWASPFQFRDTAAYEYEKYHYNASWWVLYQLTAEIGPDGLRDVLIALNAREISVAGESDPEPWDAASDWRYFYDLVEDRTGATSAEELFVTYVLNDETAGELAQRTIAHDEFDEFATESGNWSPPLVVRRELAAWDFDMTALRIDDAQDVLAVRDQITARAAELGVTVVQQAEIPYEMAASVSDLRNAETQARRQLATLDELAEQRASVEAAAAELGVTVRFPSGGFEGVAEASDAVSSRLDDLAERRGQAEQRAGELDLAMPAWPVAAPGNTDQQIDAQLETIDQRLDAILLIRRAEERADAPVGPMALIGLLGRDPNGTIDDARAAFEDGELGEVARLTSAAETTLDDAQSSGRRRVLGAAFAIVAVVGIASFLKRRPKPVDTRH